MVKQTFCHFYFGLRQLSMLNQGWIRRLEQYAQFIDLQTDSKRRSVTKAIQTWWLGLFLIRKNRKITMMKKRTSLSWTGLHSDNCSVEIREYVKGKCSRWRSDLASVAACLSNYTLLSLIKKRTVHCPVRKITVKNWYQSPSGFTNGFCAGENMKLGFSRWNTRKGKELSECMYVHIQSQNSYR